MKLVIKIMDFLSTLKLSSSSSKEYQDQISVLDCGYVRLVDFSPRICPEGCNPEFRIAEAARISTGKSHRSMAEDAKLIEYLYRNKHTSPFEMCHVQIELYLPIAIAVHFLRHRSGAYNQSSTRYAEVIKDDFYDPLAWECGVRTKNTINKQGSILLPPTTTNNSITSVSDNNSNDSQHKQRQEIVDLLTKANEITKLQYESYKQLVSAGLATEIARFYLPASLYTNLLIKFDLNNLLKMLRLRCDKHAQLETQSYANAIVELCKPIFPTTFALWQLETDSMILYPDEIMAIQSDCQSLDTTTSVSRKLEFETKRSRLYKKQDEGDKEDKEDKEEKSV